MDLCLCANADVVAAFKDYEGRRRARAARVVMEARRFGRLGQLENPIAVTLRDFAVRMTPRGLSLRSLRWLYEFGA